uniref:C-C motif chemokine n=2 Tax=Bos TaxID=9903 RepID=A0AAF6YUG4_BOVIN
FKWFSLALYFHLTVLYLAEPAGNMRVCCFSSVTRKIPLSLVKNYERTGDKCPQEAVIFQTRSGRSICANPGQAWVQKYIEYLDQMSK